VHGRAFSGIPGDNIIILDNALSVPIFDALQAGHASPHGFSANLPILGAPAGGLQWFEYLLQHDLRGGYGDILKSLIYRVV
jgi:hypothetical protein